MADITALKTTIENRMIKNKMPYNCKKCNGSFSPLENRYLDAEKQMIGKKYTSLTFLYYVIQDFENFQMVKCPHCGAIYKEDSLKLFSIFKPAQILALLIIFDIIILFYGYLIYKSGH